MKKRLLSLVLCLVMVFSLFPAFGMNAAAAETVYEPFSNDDWTAAQLSGSNTSFVPSGRTADDTKFYYYDSVSNAYYPVKVAGVSRAAGNDMPLAFNPTNFSTAAGKVDTITFTSGRSNVETDIYRSAYFVKTSTDVYRTLYFGYYDHSHLNYYEYFPFYYEGSSRMELMVHGATCNYYTATNQFRGTEITGKAYYYDYDGWYASDDRGSSISDGGFRPKKGEHNDFKYDLYQLTDSGNNLIYYSNPNAYESSHSGDGKVTLAYNPNSAASLTDVTLYYKATLEPASITANNTDVTVEMGTTATVNLTFTDCAFARVETGNAQVATAEYDSATGALTITPVSVDETVITVYGTGAAGHMTPVPLQIQVSVIPNNYVPPVLATSEPYNKTDNGGDGNIFLSKELQGSDDTYKITMEAYSTGKTASDVTSVSKPTDIILVLDQSYSMTGTDMTSAGGYHAVNSLDFDRWEEDNIDGYIKVDGEYYKLHASRTSSIGGSYTYWYVDNNNSDHYLLQNYKNHSTIYRNDTDPSGNPVYFDLYEYDSGGTRITRTEALQDAANSFIDAVAEQKDKDGNTINHRIAVVGYANNEQTSGGRTPYENTEIFVGSTQYGYNSNNLNSHLYESLQDVSTSAGVTNLHNSVDALDNEQDTYSNLGMELAQRVLNSRTQEEKDTRNTAVILFTDGDPGGGDYNADGVQVADASISIAETLKSQGTVIFTVGILTDDTEYIQNGRNSDSPYEIKRYMNYVSSNYRGVTCLADEATASSDKYYTNVKNGNISLTDLFESISESISDTSVTLGPDSELRDGINTTNFTTPDADDVKVYTVPVQVVNGEVVEDGDRVLDENGTYTVRVNEDGVVSVTNFDYSQNYVTETKEGLKLIVEITNLKAKVTGDQIAANVAEPSTDVAGIFAKDADHPTAMVDIPWVNIHPASPITADAEMNKVLNDPAADGAYSITLDAYAKGDSKSTSTFVSNAPVDIVVVVDNSDSMFSNYMSDGATTRNAAVIKGIESLIGDVDSGDARIAIVRGGKAGTGDSATAVYDDNQSVKYDTVMAGTVTNTDDYFKSAADQKAELENEITLLADQTHEKNSMFLNTTFEVVQKLLNNRSDTSRNAAVVFFSDGAMNFYSGNGNHPEQGFNAVKNTDAISGVDVFTAFITTYNEDTATNTDIKRSDRMKGFSSEYPNAEYTSGDVVPGSPSGDTHYYQRVNTSTAADFSAVVTTITQTIGSEIRLDHTAYLEDVIDLDNFDVIIPNGATKPVIRVETVNGTADYLGNVTFDESTRTDITNSVAVNYTVTTDQETGKQLGSVRVSNFDFSDHHISFGCPGQKLIVTIEGLVPKHAGDAADEDKLFSNTSAGLYDADGSPADTADNQFTKVGSHTIVIDYNYPILLTNTTAGKDNATINGTTFALKGKTELRAKSGFYKADERGMTYQLFTGSVNPDAEGESTSAASMTLNFFGGVDQAVVFNGTAWGEFKTLPATSVYFSDDLTAPQTSLEGVGHNDDVSPAAEPFTDGEHSRIVSYTFTGTGVDVYTETIPAPTEANGVKPSRITGQIIAEGSTATYTNPNTHEKCMRTIYNQSVTPRYNVPTMFFHDLPYGTYTLKLIVGANSTYKIDGIRVYNPVGAANANEEAVQAKNDAEAIYANEELREQNATFTNLRDMILTGKDLTTSTGAIGYFTDSNGAATTGYKWNETDKKYDKTNYPAKTLGVYEVDGPKNEIYLEGGTALAFTIKNWSQISNKVDDVELVKLMVGLSVPQGGEANVNLGRTPNEKITSEMDMYYEITPVVAQDGQTATVTITNVSGSALLAVTNLKVSGRDVPIKPTMDISLNAQALSVSEEAEDTAVMPMYIAVTQETVEYAARLNAIADGALEEIPADPTPTDPAPTEDPEPTQQPTIVDMIRQILSDFVSRLFGSISRLFGN